ncbi:hypothetical protein MRX96_016260 [Rhipicephalus microplus]
MSLRKNKLGDEMSGARPKPRSRTSGRDEELLRSLHAALSTHKPANAMVDRETRFRIIKVEPKWRVTREVPTTKVTSKTRRAARAASPGVSTTHLTSSLSRKQPKARDSSGARLWEKPLVASPSTEQNPAGPSSTPSAAVAHASLQKSRLGSRNKRSSSPVLRSPRSDKAANTSAAWRGTNVVTGKESAARRDESKREDEGNAAEEARNAATRSGKLVRPFSENRDEYGMQLDSPSLFPPPTFDVPRLSVEIAIPSLRKESADPSIGQAPPEDSLAPMPRKSPRKTKVALRSNLSVSRHNVENMNSAESSSVDLAVPQPRKRTGSLAVPDVAGASQSHAVGLALESSRYSMQDLGTARMPVALPKLSGRLGGPSVTALTRPSEAVSHASLRIAYPPAQLSGVGGAVATSDTSTSAQRALRSDVEGTSHLQQTLESGVPKPWHTMSGACFSACLASPKINEAESSEKLCAAVDTTNTLPNKKDCFFITAPLTSFSGCSLDDTSPRHSRLPSGPNVVSRAVGAKRGSRLPSRADPSDTFQSVGDERKLLPPTVRRPSSNRRSVPSTADVSRGAVHQANDSSGETLFYSASSADLPRTTTTRECFVSMLSEDACLQRGAPQKRRSPSKGGQQSSSAQVPQSTVLNDDLLSNGATLNKVLGPTKPQAQASNAGRNDRRSLPSVAVQTIDSGRRTTLPATRPAVVVTDMRKTSLPSGRTDPTDDKGNKQSLSLDAGALQITEKRTVEKPKKDGESAVEVSKSNRGDAPTDSVYYTATELRHTDQRRSSESKQVRGEAAFEVTMKQNTTSRQNATSPLPGMLYKFINAMKAELPGAGKTPSSSPGESWTLHGASTKLDHRYNALFDKAAIGPLCIYRSASEQQYQHGKRHTSLMPGQMERSYSRNGEAYAEKAAASTSTNSLSRNDNHPECVNMARGGRLVEELHPRDTEGSYSLFPIPPISRGRETDTDLILSVAENIRGHKLGMGPRAIVRCGASSEVPHSTWNSRSSILSLARSLASPVSHDSIRLLMFSRPSRARFADGKRAPFTGDPMFPSMLVLPPTPPHTCLPSDPSFRTARSYSVPNFVASRPLALRARSLSDSMIVNPSSSTSQDANVRRTSTRSPSDGVLRKTAELAVERQLPKVAPKKKRPRRTLMVKPTAAVTNVVAQYPRDTTARVSTAGSPGVTGVEVSMTSRSHARELCLSMLAMTVAVLGLVLLARSAGTLSRVAIPNFDANAPTGNLSGRAANETANVQTTTTRPVAALPMVCNLSRCLEEGTHIAGLLSWDSDPCVDFYEFACSVWVQERAASASIRGGASASIIEDMERDLEQMVPRLLAAVRSPELSPLRRLHDTCNNVNAINAAGWAPLADLLRLCGLPDWPYEQPATVSPWKAAARALQYTGAEAFVSLEVMPHPLRGNRTVCALDRPMLVLRSSDLSAQDVHWLEDAADAVMTAFRERPRHLARESVAMAVQIARLAYSRDALSDVRLYRVVHLGPFPQLLEFLSTLFKNISSVHASTEVLLRAEGFLRDLLDLADEHKNRALLNYVGLLVAAHGSAFLPDAVGLRTVHARVLLPHEPAGGYVPRERLCARQVASTMPFLFFYAVRLLFGGEATVRALTSTLEMVRRHLVRHLEKLALADYSTRVQLVDIAKETSFHVLGPPGLSNESFLLAHARALPTAGDDEPLLWFARVTAHVTQLRLMRLSRYVWRGGAFDRDCSSDLQTNAVFTPHLGARFVRCLLVMLLAGVSNRGNRELVTRGWWSDASKSALGALRRCLARAAGPDDADDGDAPARPEKAPLSIVAEALAVPPALDAFTEGLRALAGPGLDFRLPRVEGLAPAQLFFDYYALSRCRRERFVGRGGGGSAADEVNGPLRQSTAFHAAFECARGRPMNRAAPCNLWS